jgi:hypothetical protein
VKDKNELMASLSNTDYINILNEKNGSIAITGEYSGGWPTYGVYDSKLFDFAQELSAFLADDEIAVLFEAGTGKLRFITGIVVAIDNSGQRTEVSLNDIYDLS